MISKFNEIPELKIITNLVNELKLDSNKVYNLNDQFVKALLIASGVDKSDITRYLKSFSKLLEIVKIKLGEDMGELDIVKTIYDSLWDIEVIEGLKKREIDPDYRYKSDQGQFHIAVENQIDQPTKGVGDCVSLTCIFSCLLLYLTNSVHISLIYYELANAKDFGSVVKFHLLNKIMVNEDTLTIENTSFQKFNVEIPTNHSIEPLYYLFIHQLRKTIQKCKLNSNRNLEYSFCSLQIEENPSTLQLHGSVLKNLKKIDEAENYFMKSLDLDKNYLPSLLNLAELYLEKGDFDKALQYLDHILDKYPMNISAMFNKGVTLYNQTKTNIIESFNLVLTACLKLNRIDPKFKLFIDVLYEIYEKLPSNEKNDHQILRAIFNVSRIYSYKHDLAKSYYERLKNEI